VDFAMAASQNGFSTCELSLHKKINIIKKKMAKNIGFFLTFIFYREKRSLYDTFVELCKHRFVTQPLLDPPLCSSTHKIHLKS
jgi:hypothetical protein